MNGAVSTLAVAAMVLGAAGQARSGTLYSNINATADGTDSVIYGPGYYGPLADSFSTGASNVSLLDIQVVDKCQRCSPRRWLRPGPASEQQQHQSITQSSAAS